MKNICSINRVLTLLYKVEYKKSTKTVATFFYGDDCFIFNNMY